MGGIKQLAGIFAILATPYFLLAADFTDIFTGLSHNLPPHPRLFLCKSGEDFIKKNISKNPSAANYHSQIILAAKNMLSKPPCERKLEGRRLLHVSNEVLKRVFYLSYAFRTTGDKRFAERAKSEMIAAAKFPDWNPSHFLDVGEMALALSIGYDWLFDQLDEDSKKLISTALLEKAMREADKNTAPLAAGNNWSSVCNAGIICAAIATFESHCEYAISTIERSIKLNRRAMEQYAPDGNYIEGASYWNYGTSFQLVIIKALESFAGEDFGYWDYPGFIASAKYMRSIAGPTGYYFNYSDSGTGRSAFSFAHILISNKSGDAESFTPLKRNEKISERLAPMTMIFASDNNLYGATPPKWKNFFGRGKSPVALLRTDWEGDSAIFLGMKGGSASIPHAHMDAGTFVLDIGKTRWICEIPPRPYNDIESHNIKLWDMGQKSQRWKLLRYGNTSHSVLIADGKDFPVGASATLKETFETPGKAGAIFDTTPLYRDIFKYASREGAIVDSSYLRITDTVRTSDRPVNIRWNFCTQAEPQIIGDGKSIMLKKDGKSLIIKMDSIYPAKAKIYAPKLVIENDIPIEGYYFAGFDLSVPPNAEAVLNVTFKPAIGK